MPQPCGHSGNLNVHWQHLGSLSGDRFALSQPVHRLVPKILEPSARCELVRVLPCSPERQVILKERKSLWLFL